MPCRHMRNIVFMEKEEECRTCITLGRNIYRYALQRILDRVNHFDGFDFPQLVKDIVTIVTKALQEKT